MRAAVHASLGDRARRRGDWQIGLKHYEAAADVKPDTPSYWMRCGHCLKGLGRIDEAIAAFASGTALGEPRTDYLLHLAGAFRANNEFARAFDALEAARKCQNSEDFRLQLEQACADLARDANDTHRAANHYRVVVELAPSNHAMWMQLGHSLKQQDELAEAERAYREATRLAPQNPEHWLELGGIQMKLGRLVDAQRAFKEAIHLCPGAAENWMQLGHALKHQGELLDAEQAYREATRIEPQRPAQWLELSDIRIRLGRLTEAEKALGEAIRLNPADPQNWVDYGHHYLRLERRLDAAACFARALGHDREHSNARRALEYASGFSPTEVLEHLERAREQLENSDNDWALRERVGRVETQRAKTLWYKPGLSGSEQISPLKIRDERHQRLLAAARDDGRLGERLPLIWLPNIEWHYRRQRPQHLAHACGQSGTLVIYVSGTIEQAAAPSFRLNEKTSARVFEARLRCKQTAVGDVYRGFSPEAARELGEALAQLTNELEISKPVVVVEHPNWLPVLAELPAATILYDCLDRVTEFEEPSPITAINEAELIASADLVVCTSLAIKKDVEVHRPANLIHNGVEWARFKGDGSRPLLKTNKVVIGYFGAIASWFEVEWIAHCASRRPSWTFVLIGEILDAKARGLGQIQNVELIGEIPYAALPEYLKTFDVGIIPFKLTPLIEATDPVKLHEYLAGGVPIVASRMPEVEACGADAYFADDAASFEAAIETALREDTSARRLARIQQAREQDWSLRCRDLLGLIDEQLRHTFDGRHKKMSGGLDGVQSLLE